MGAANYLCYAGLNSPVHLDGADALLPLLSSALSAWPVYTSRTPPSTPAFVSLRGHAKGMYEIDVHADSSEARQWDAVNAICDLVAEMAWEKLRTRPDLLCVHGAAVQFGERLILFPNAKRAGKSTLTCALAHLGRTVFTDDFLPIEIAHDGGIRGIANGVAPRLRLPIPGGFSEGFKTWAQSDSGPANRQYKYLAHAPLADNGESLPLGAIVILDRQDCPTAPRLEDFARAAAIGSMIIQNFARALHAGTILQSIDTLTASLPTYRLVYHSAEEAAAFLQSLDQFQALPIAKLDGPKKPSLAPLDQLDSRPGPFYPDTAYVQGVGLAETRAEGEHFLADQSGLAIHHLNPGSAAIWRLLAQPITLTEVVEVLRAAFPDTDPDQIATDSLATLQKLAAARLIAPVSLALSAAAS